MHERECSFLGAYIKPYRSVSMGANRIPYRRKPLSGKRKGNLRVNRTGSGR